MHLLMSQGQLHAVGPHYFTLICCQVQLLFWFPKLTLMVCTTYASSLFSKCNISVILKCLLVLWELVCQGSVCTPFSTQALSHPNMSLQASLVMAKAAGSGHAGTTGKSWLSVAQRGSGQHGAGLRNATRENNCFLNVIVQCLWRCDSFRNAVMRWPQAVYQVRKTATVIIVCVVSFVVDARPQINARDHHSCIITAASLDTCIKLLWFSAPCLQLAKQTSKSWWVVFARRQGTDSMSCHVVSCRHMYVQMPWLFMQASDIASALVHLFNTFAQQAQGHLRTEVDPTQLREALSRLPGNKFGVGEHPTC